MFRMNFLSLMLIICTLLLTLVPLAAQEEEGKIIIISERVGKQIDPQERDKFMLFQGVKGFQSAVYLKLPDGRYFLKITYLDAETGELKIKRIEQSEVLIKISRDYINHFEETTANQDTVYLKSRLAFFLELGVKIWYSLMEEIKV